MFNLEQSITEWRRQMLAVGIKQAALEELESHLREEIEQQEKSGQTPQQAFEIAMKTIGPGTELNKEFKKTGDPLVTLVARFVSLVGIGCGSIAFLLSLWCLFLLFFNQPDWVMKIQGLAALATAIFSWKYGYKFLPVIAPRGFRTLLGFACCAGGVVGYKYLSKNSCRSWCSIPRDRTWPKAGYWGYLSVCPQSWLF